MNHQETYNTMAESCARHLVRMFDGDTQSAIDALTNDPIAMVEVALDSHMHAMRKMAVKAHMNQRDTALAVLNMISR